MMPCAISFESGAQGNAPAVALDVLQRATGSPSVSGAGTRLVVTAQLGLGVASLGQSGGTGTLQMASSGAYEVDVSGGTLRLGERNLGPAVVQAGPGGQIVYTNTTLNGGLLIGAGSHDASAVRRMVSTCVGGGAVLTPAPRVSFVGVVNGGRINNIVERSLTWASGGNPSGTLVLSGTTSVSSFNSGGQIQVNASGRLVGTGGNLVLGGGSRTTVGTASLPGGTVELQAGGRLQLAVQGGDLYLQFAPEPAPLRTQLGTPSAAKCSTHSRAGSTATRREASSS